MLMMILRAWLGRAWHRATSREVSGISVKGMRMRMLLALRRKKRPMPNTKVIYRPVMPNDDTVAPIKPLWTRSRIVTSLQQVSYAEMLTLMWLQTIRAVLTTA